jgi:SET family sugar efflux transporter-like MFS transporter
MADRPGTGSSLLAVQRVTADVICALAFTMGTALGGYALAALLGAVITLTGAVLLLAADRQRR